MNPATIGALAGLFVAIFGYAIIQIALDKQAGRSKHPQDARSAAILHKIAVLDLILFPVIGYFMGPVLLS